MAAGVPAAAVDSLAVAPGTVRHVFVQQHFATGDRQVSKCLRSQPPHSVPRYLSLAADQAPRLGSLVAEVIHAEHGLLRLKQ